MLTTLREVGFGPGNIPGWQIIFSEAREASITASQLFQWRIAYTNGSLVAVGANEPVVPASGMKDALKRIKQLEAL